MPADWWLEISREIEAQGHDRWSAAWWAAFRDAHAARFPDADARTKQNLQILVDSAVARETNAALGIGINRRPIDEGAV